MLENIIVKGARENNLKNVDVEIPREKLVVITGISGSGKSSLAFDTIYAEGQRRYVESLSSYARMFLGQKEKPDVDSIDGLSPAISIDQKTTGQNPRSTVGTVTEIYDYLRLLWARVGVPHCPKCGREIRRQTVDQIVDKILTLPEGTRLQLLAPVIRGKKGEHLKIFDDARRGGFARVRVDGSIYDLTEEIKLNKNQKHQIEIVVDRLIVKPGLQRRLTDSVETAAALAGGIVICAPTEGEELLFSQNYACEVCGISVEEVNPRTFSFNNPYGACPGCAGLGVRLTADEDLVLPNRDLSLNRGAVTVSGWSNLKNDSIAKMYYEALGKKYGFTLDTPVVDFSEEALRALLYGTNGEKLELEYDKPRGKGILTQPFEGLLSNVERRYKESGSDSIREELEQYMSEQPCPACGGKRLRPEALAVTVGGENIADFSDRSVTSAASFIDRLVFTDREMQIARRILKEIKNRLGFLESVGLNYLTLSRKAGSLSGGESQRIRLATQIGSALMGVLYILDEPSIGLHQRDNDKLLRTLKELRDMGNTVLVVEHDEDTMLAADRIIDVGPGAGSNGGRIVAQGTAREVMDTPGSVTGEYLSGRKYIPVPAARRPGNGKYLTVLGAAENNLREIDVAFPLGTLVCVTGVSGSGKSSLVNEVLYKALQNKLNHARVRPGRHRSVEGLEALDKVINIDQSPIGRTPRSNPATYTGLFGDIRDLFASTQDAKVRGYGPGRFSFNVRGGRCEACGGDGLVKIEMHFLPDVYVPCEVCGGKRYNRETLEVRWKGKNISDVLDMTVDDAMDFFANQPRLAKKLQTLVDVGLGYVKLGQSSTTLSGGEAQRVKLATELSRPATGRTLYVLDEPTTGLHTADIHRLTRVLARLVDTGNTVVVIEHNLDVIKQADWIIDLGPEGGDGGGSVVFAGTPEALIECPQSYTGQFLKKYFDEHPGQRE